MIVIHRSSCSIVWPIIASTTTYNIRQFTRKTFTPDLCTKIAKVDIHRSTRCLPCCYVISSLESSTTTTTVLTGNSAAVFVVGQTVGKSAGYAAEDAFRNVVGLVRI